MKKLIAVACSITLISNMSFDASFAYADYQVANANYLQSEEVVVNGISVDVQLDKHNNLIVKSAELGEGTQLVIHPNATGEAVIENDEGEFDEFELDINKLEKNDIDISVTSEDGAVFNLDEDTIIPDDYSGQMVAVAVPIVYEGLTVLIEAVAVGALAVVVGGAGYYAATLVTNVVSQPKNKPRRSHYYKAVHQSSGVYICSGKAISKSTAIQRIRRGLDIYTYTSKNAKAAVLGVGKGVVGPEITSKRNRKPNTAYYYHYHTKNRNGAHSFYGTPVYG